MKNYSKIVENYTTTSNELQTIERTLEPLYNELHNLAAAHDFAGYKACKDSTSNEIIRLEETKHLLELALKYAKDNCRIAFYENSIEVFCEAWNKFAGKKLGERTKEKIQEVTKAAPLPFSWYFKCGCDWLEFIPLNEEGYSGRTVFGYEDIQIDCLKNILVDNVIQEITPEDFRLMSSGKFTTDTKKAAERAIKEHSKMVKAFNEFKKVYDDYMDLCPSAIRKQKEYISQPRAI